MFVGEILSVTGTDDLGTGIVAKDKGRESHCSGMGFKRARQHIDDEPSDLPMSAGLQF